MTSNSIPVFILSNDPRGRSCQDKPPELNVIALTLTRDLGRADVTVIRFHPNKFDPGLSSKYCIAVECPYLNENRGEDLLAFLIEYSQRFNKRGVLFPAGDGCLEFINNHQDVLRKYYLIPMPNKNIIENILNKKRQYELASVAGIEIPETYFPNNEEEVITLAKKVRYPSVIKPIISHSWRNPLCEDNLKLGKAVKINNVEELVSNYQKIAIVNKNIMVQEIIGGDIKNTITFLGYYNKNSKLMGYSMREKIRQYPLGFGYCCLTKSRNVPAVKDLADKLLRSMHYIGIAGVEFKLNLRDNKYKLIEINARPFQTIGLSAAAGVNLPYIAYLDVQGLYNESKDVSFKENVTWIYLDKELDMLRLLLKQRKIRFCDWLRIFKGEKVFADFDLNDLMPFVKICWWKIVFSVLKRVKRIK